MAMLRLATYNVLHGMDLSDGTCAPERLKASVHQVDADLLGLQEADVGQPRSGGIDQVAAAAAALGARWHRFEPTVLGTPGVPGWRPAAPPGTVDTLPEDQATPAGPTYGVGLVSRLPVRRWAVRRFPPSPGRLPLLVPTGGRSRVTLVPDEPRAALAAVVEGPHGPFTVVTTHLTFVPGFNLRQLRAVTRWAAALPRPVFVLGDLNLPGRVPARATGWTALVSGATYPAASPRAQLDHVLAYGLADGAVRAQQVWTPAVSDHRPVSVDVEL
jgi:endonuclease/exonuclease/phosphatase family metal-dependent hydrolase